MKALLHLLIVALLFTTNLFAQNQKCEFGLNMLYIGQTVPAYYGPRSNAAVSTLFNPGIYAKHFWKDNGIRLVFNLRNELIAIDETGHNGFWFKANGVSTTAQLKLGYEHKFGNRIVQPFVFSDIFCQRQSNKGKMMNYDDAMTGYEYIPFVANTWHYGLGIGGGAKIKIYDHLLLSLESQVQFGQYFSAYPGTIYTVIKNNNILLMPLSQCGISVMF